MGKREMESVSAEVEINNPNSTINIGDTLRNRENVTREIQIKGIEMINYGSNFKNRRLDIKGKTLIVLN